jgi:hypothetical protein
MPSYNPPNAFYSQLSIPTYVHPMALMGPNGFHFKNITHLSGCDYLWYDGYRGVVEIWSKNRHNLPKAKEMLIRHINLMY